MTKAEKYASRRNTCLLLLVLAGTVGLTAAVLWTSRDAGRQERRADTAQVQADAAELDRATACAQVQALGLRCAVPLPPEQATDPTVDSPPLAGRDGAQGPSGAVGITGPRGPTGPAGLSAYQLAVRGGYEGTLAQWLASLKGRDGADGQDGADGKDGADGTPGTPGADGTAGTPGDPGAPGQPGTDGAPGTPGADGQTCVDRDQDDLWACTTGPYSGPQETVEQDTPPDPAPTPSPPLPADPTLIRRVR